MDLHEQRPFYSVITETAPAVVRGGVPLHSLTLAVGDGLANVHQPGSENLQIEQDISSLITRVYLAGLG